MKLSTRLRLQRLCVWAARLIVGATFILSGWGKAVDPIGFVIKVGEYLSVWDFSVPHEAIVAGCVSLACIEFLTGVLILFGALKRVAVYAAAAMMAFMLPLTAYIAIANPVSDCGCFGDLWQISNTATFLKNVVLSMLIVYLLMRNSRVGGVYPAPVQWLVVTLSLAFPLTLALAGYQIQPLLDFRPYKTGTTIFAAGNPDDAIKYIYEKDGERRSFTLDQLPDSTWTYVDEETAQDSDGNFDGGIAVHDAEGYDVSADLADTEADRLYLIIPQPGMHYLTRAHYVSRLQRYCDEHGIELIAVLGGSDQRRQQWADWCRPDFDVYTADAVSLMQLVRGAEALVYTEGGIIRWKRTLSAMPLDLPDSTSPDALSAMRAPDDGTYFGWILLIYLASMLLVYLLSLSPKILRLFMRRNS